MAKGNSKKARWKAGRLVASAVLLLTASAAALPLLAEEPVLNDLQPRGGQRGKTFTLTLKGEGLSAGADLIASLPCTVTKLAPRPDAEMPDGELNYLVRIPEDAPVGAYPLRVKTPGGLSNVQIFTVSDLQEIAEKEPNDSIGEAQPITAPLAIRGTLKGPDQDFFSFTVLAHQRLVFEVEARRIGSAIDPAIELYDAAGRMIAQNDDAPGLGVDSRLDMTFPEAGKYFVAVHDSKYSDQPENFYRLKIGSFVYAEGIYPLGWQRGHSVAVTLFGGNLPHPVVVHPTLDVPAGREFVAVDVPGAKPLGSLPFQFQVGDLPESMPEVGGRVTELLPMTVVNGRILKPGEVDHYKLKVAPGEDWTLELNAATLGTSLLYGSITVTDEEGKKLEVNDASWGADPRLTLKVPDKVHELALAVSDIRGQGGPAYGYRLVARPEPGDYALKLLTPYVNIPARGTAVIRVAAERHGYNGPIRLSIPNLPDDFAFAGGNIVYEQDSATKRLPITNGYITLTAKPDAKPRTLNLSVWGEGGPPAHAIRRRAEGPGLIFAVKGEEILNLTGDATPTKPTIYPWMGIELPVALGASLPAELQVGDRDVRAVQGMDFPLSFRVIKQGAGIVTDNVRELTLPRVKDLISKNRNDLIGVDKGNLMMGTTQDTPLVKFDLVLSANLVVNGKAQTVVAPAITVELVRAYTLELKSPKVTLRSGGKVELAGVIHREPSFPGTVKISVGDPPDKVSCGSLEVPNGKSDFSLTCAALPGAQAGEFDVHLVSSAIIPGTDKREYTFPPVETQMVIGGDKVAASTKGIQQIHP